MNLKNEYFLIFETGGSSIDDLLPQVFLKSFWKRQIQSDITYKLVYLCFWQTNTIFKLLAYRIKLKILGHTVQMFPIKGLNIHHVLEFLYEKDEYN